MTNHQGYAVWWDDTDELGREVKHHRYFNTLHGAQCFASLLNEDSTNNAKVTERPLISFDQMSTAERSLVQKLNQDELTRLMLEFGFTIRVKDFPNWRPTKRSMGTVPGVWEQVELIATDGLLGIFLNGTTEPIFGHIQMFDGHVETLFTAEKKTKVKKPKKLSRRQQILESI